MLDTIKIKTSISVSEPTVSDTVPGGELMFSYESENLYISGALPGDSPILIARGTNSTKVYEDVSSGAVYYVDKNNVYSSDDLQNSGQNFDRPFYSIERAIAQSVRDNHYSATVVVMPGLYYVNNKLGTASTTGVSTVSELNPNDRTGVVVPAGVSIVALDSSNTYLSPIDVLASDSNTLLLEAGSSLTGLIFVDNDFSIRTNTSANPDSMTGHTHIGSVPSSYVSVYQAKVQSLFSVTLTNSYVKKNFPKTAIESCQINSAQDLASVVLNFSADLNQCIFSTSALNTTQTCLEVSESDSRVNLSDVKIQGWSKSLSTLGGSVVDCDELCQFSGLVESSGVTSNPTEVLSGYSITSVSSPKGLTSSSIPSAEIDWFNTTNYFSVTYGSTASALTLDRIYVVDQTVNVLKDELNFKNSTNLYLGNINLYVATVSTGNVVEYDAVRKKTYININPTASTLLTNFGANGLLFNSVFPGSVSTGLYSTPLGLAVAESPVLYYTGNLEKRAHRNRFFYYRVDRTSNASPKLKVGDELLLGSTSSLSTRTPGSTFYVADAFDRDSDSQYILIGRSSKSSTDRTSVSPEAIFEQELTEKVFLSNTKSTSRASTSAYLVLSSSFSQLSAVYGLTSTFSNNLHALRETTLTAPITVKRVRTSLVNLRGASFASIKEEFGGFVNYNGRLESLEAIMSRGLHNPVSDYDGITPKSLSIEGESKLPMSSSADWRISGATKQIANPLSVARSTGADITSLSQILSVSAFNREDQDPVVTSLGVKYAFEGNRARDFDRDPSNWSTNNLSVNKLIQVKDQATETLFGISRLASVSEITANNNVNVEDKVITIKTFRQWIDPRLTPVATTTIQGKTELATTTEVVQSTSGNTSLIGTALTLTEQEDPRVVNIFTLSKALLSNRALSSQRDPALGLASDKYVTPTDLANRQLVGLGQTSTASSAVSSALGDLSRTNLSSLTASQLDSNQYINASILKTVIESVTANNTELGSGVTVPTVNSSDRYIKASHRMTTGLFGLGYLADTSSLITTTGGNSSLSLIPINSSTLNSQALVNDTALIATLSAIRADAGSRPVSGPLSPTRFITPQMTADTGFVGVSAISEVTDAIAFFDGDPSSQLSTTGYETDYRLLNYRQLHGLLGSIRANSTTDLNKDTYNSFARLRLVTNKNTSSFHTLGLTYMENIDTLDSYFKISDSQDWFNGTWLVDAPGNFFEAQSINMIQLKGIMDKKVADRSQLSASNSLSSLQSNEYNRHVIPSQRADYYSYGLTRFVKMNELDSGVFDSDLSVSAGTFIHYMNRLVAKIQEDFQLKPGRTGFFS